MWSGKVAPISFARVGSKSMLIARSSLTRPAGMWPGQRAMNGTRVPPSHAVVLPSRSGSAEPAWLP